MSGEGWKERLFEAIEADSRSDRAISLGAKLGPNYIEQMRKKGKMPGADAVLKLCKALGISPVFLLTGMQITPEEEEVLTLLASLSDEQRQRFLGFLRDLQPASAVRE